MGSSNRPPRARRRPGPGLPGLTTRSPRLDLDGTVTACVPRSDLVRPVAAGLADLTPREATSPDIVRARLPVTRAVLGPALLYPPAGFKAHRIPGVEEACRGDVEDLITSASPGSSTRAGCVRSPQPAVHQPSVHRRCSRRLRLPLLAQPCRPPVGSHPLHPPTRTPCSTRRGVQRSATRSPSSSSRNGGHGPKVLRTSTRPPTRPGRARDTTQPGARLSSRSGKSGTWAGSP